jgi:hypothetical protein
MIKLVKIKPGSFAVIVAILSSLSGFISVSVSTFMLILGGTQKPWYVYLMGPIIIIPINFFLGYISGYLFCFAYNLFAKKTGGIKFELVQEEE